MSRPLRLALLGVAGVVLLTVTARQYIGAPYSPPPLAGGSEPPPVTAAHDGPALVRQLEARPLNLPVASLQPDFRCPASPAQSGPVRLRTPARSPGGISVLLFDVADWYAGALLIRGERLDGGAAMSFQPTGGYDYQPEAVFHVPVHRGDSEETVVASSDAGCWAIAVDGYQVRQVFLVNLR